jgi:MoaA/NifB/PqqE/SkfB family radical SAM enzyme
MLSPATVVWEDLVWLSRRWAEPLAAWLRSRGDRPHLLLGKENQFQLNRVFVSPTRTCNARCGFCAYPKMVVPHETLALSMFSDFVAQWADVGGKRINLTPTFGEPLLDPNLALKILRAKELGMHVRFTTNAILLEKYAQDLVDAGIDALHVSLPSFSRYEYFRVYGVDRADDVFKGLRKYLLIRKPGQELILCFRHACRPSALLWHPSFADLYSISDGQDFRWEFTYSFDNWMGQIQRLPEGMKFRRNRFGNYPCRWAFSLTLEPSGNVRLCGCRYSADWSPDLNLGTVRDGITELWKRAQPILWDFYLGKRQPTCEQCTFYWAAKQSMIQ